MRSNLNSNVYLSVIVLCFDFILHDACLRFLEMRLCYQRRSFTFKYEHTYSPRTLFSLHFLW